MTNNTTANGRKVMAFFVLVAALLTITTIPTFGKQAMTGVIKAALAGVEENGDVAALLVSFMFPFMVAASVVSASILLLLVFPIYWGHYWARPIGLGLLSIICIAGAYIWGPVMVTTPNLALSALAFMFVGLIPYFTVLLGEKSSGVNKLISFFVFLLLGVTIAAGFTNGFSGMHKFFGATRLDPLMVTTEQYFTYAVGIPLEWIGALTAFIGIPLLAGRVKAGWWFAAGGVLSMLVGTIYFHLSHPNGFFLAGIVVTSITFILLLLPKVIKELLGVNTDKSQFFPSLDKKDSVQV